MDVLALNSTDLPDAGTLYVLDAHGLIFQMFHGVGPMSAPDGRPTNALFGVTRAIMDLYDRGADYLIAAFDRHEPTFRDVLYAEYKAHRDPPPADLLVQKPMIEQVLEAMRIPVLSVAGFEADDLIATLAAVGAARGLRVYLCTSDKDCRQLLTDRVTILNLRKGATLDAEGLKADWGIAPSQVVDFQTLVGDSVDNVPGVPGCGPKTAAKWLQQYGTLENVIANADAVGGPKLRDSLKKSVADGTLELSRKLVRLDPDVPLAFDWDGWRRRDWDGPKLLELFQTFGFRGFANKVRSTLGAAGAKRNEDLLQTIGATAIAPAKGKRKAAEAESPIVPRPGQASLFDVIEGTASFEPAPEATVVEATSSEEAWDYSRYEIVETAEKFDRFLDELSRQSRFTFDLETTHLEPHRAKIVGYAFAWEAKRAFYLPVRGPAGSSILDPDRTLAALKPIFENPSVAKVNQNIKYDLLVLRAAGVLLRGTTGDSMIAHYLLNAGDRSHGLDELARKYLNHGNISITALIGKGKNQKTMDQVPIEQIGKYACEDADVAWQLAEILEPDLDAQGLRKLYDEIEIPLIDVLADLEFTGVRLDQPFLKKLSGEMETQLAALEKEIHAVAGRTFNIASPKQLREILFDEMKLPVQKKTGTTGEPSTDQESLERLAALGHPLPTKIIEHRQVAKLKGTYVDALPAMVNPTTGRLHTSFNQTVAATGRLSSSDPNLQNIPARTEQGKQIRQAFLPKEGWQLLTADYSQIELRLLAHFCEDDQLLKAFAEDRDVHTIVAADIFKVPLDEVTSAHRRVAKTVNFGVIYGMSAHGLAIRLAIPRSEGEKFIDEYFARYPAVLAYQDRLLAAAHRDGFVATILGRRRRFEPDGIGTKYSYKNRTQAQREAINMEIQGSAADLMKLALMNVHKRFRAERFEAKMLLTVHDELVFEVPPNELAAVAAAVREEMIGAMKLKVALKVDVSAGPNWLEVEDV